MAPVINSNDDADDIDSARHDENRMPLKQVGALIKRAAILGTFLTQRML